MTDEELLRFAQAVADRGGSVTIAESFIPTLVSEIIELRAKVQPCGPCGDLKPPARALGPFEGIANSVLNSIL